MGDVMAILDIHTNENQSTLTAADAAAQVFVLAFKALSVEAQQAVLRRLLITATEQKSPVDALLKAIRSDRFTLPPGSPDSVDLLRENRSR